MQQIFSRLNLGCQIILVLVVFLGVVALLAPRYLQSIQERGPYSVAPTCPPGQHADSTSTECRLFTDATLVERWTEGGGSRNSSSGSKFAWVQLADGTRYKFQFPYDSIWSRVAAGYTLRVELWRGRVTKVQALGFEEPTSSNPVWEGDQLNTFAPIMVGTAIGLILILIGTRWLQRNFAAKRRR